MRSIFPFLLIFCSLIFISVTNCAGENVKKSIEDNRDDVSDANDDTIDQSMDVPASGESETNNVTCTRRQNSQMHEIRVAQHKQFPFVVAVMSDHNEFVCSGTVVANGLILTTARCIEQTISYVLLNATKAKKDNTTAVLRVVKTDKFPTYVTTDTDKDVGLIYIPKINASIASKLKLSNYTSTRNVVDVEALGFGLNSDVGTVKELQYIGLENRGYPLPMVDSRDLIRGYFDCIDTKVQTCFKDTGGPAIFDNELIGIVVKGQSECVKEISSTYAINKKIAEILPTYTFKAWLDEKILKHEEQDTAVVALATFPSKPSRRDLKPALAEKSYGNRLQITFSHMLGFIFLFLIYC